MIRLPIVVSENHSTCRRQHVVAGQQQEGRQVLRRRCYVSHCVRPLLVLVVVLVSTKLSSVVTAFVDFARPIKVLQQQYNNNIPLVGKCTFGYQKTVRETKAMTAVVVLRKTTTKTQLLAIPPSTFINGIICTRPIVVTIVLAVVHVLLGASGTPIVARAIKDPAGWYKKITLPSWTPSDKIFPVAWTILYMLMGISVSRIIITSTTRTVLLLPIPLLTLYLFHFILNLLWAPIFFGTKNLRLGLGINYMLLFTLAFGILRPFYSIDPVAGILLAPYLIWLMFATVLNETICVLNPTIKGYNNAKFYADLYQLQQNAYKYAFE